VVVAVELYLAELVELVVVEVPIPVKMEQMETVLVLGQRGLEELNPGVGLEALPRLAEPTEKMVVYPRMLVEVEEMLPVEMEGVVLAELMAAEQAGIFREQEAVEVVVVADILEAGPVLRPELRLELDMVVAVLVGQIILVEQL
jgi:hypothetical protein